MGARRVAVFGQVARDVVLVVDELPQASRSATVHRRRELLGGKGANQAVGLAQLGARPLLVGVVGDDDDGDAVLAQAVADGIDTAGVVRRRGVRTGLIVDVVEPGRSHRFLEHLPTPVLLRPEDVEAAAPDLTGMEWVAVQLQQPPAAAEAAAAAGRRAGARVLLDGAVTARHVPRLAGLADVIRVDTHEAELVAGHRVAGADGARRAARALLALGPAVVAVGAAGDGNVLVSRSDEVLVPLSTTAVVDTTGGGDAFVAGLLTALADGDDLHRAGQRASAAAASTVAHAGGRPDLRRSRRQPPLDPDADR